MVLVVGIPEDDVATAGGTDVWGKVNGLGPSLKSTSGISSDGLFGI